MLPGQTYTPEELLRILWCRKWLIVLPAVLVMFGTLAHTSRLPDEYRSETLIMVVPQRVPESYVRSTVTAPIEDRLSTIQQQILSRSRLERIVLDFNLYQTERQRLVMEDVVERMRLDITVTLERGDAFRVSFVSTDPRVAQQVTERLASLFIEENLRDREVLAEATNQFLDSQLDDARRRLIEHEKRLEAYRRQHAGQLPTQVQANLGGIQTAQIRLQALSESRNRDTDRRLAFERQLAELEASNVATRARDAAPAGEAVATTERDVPARQGASEQLNAASEQLRIMELRYKPEHPNVVATRRLIRDLEAKLAAESSVRQSATSTPSPTAPIAVDPAEVARVSRIEQVRGELQNLEIALKQNQGESQRLESVLNTYQANVDAVPARESEMVELMRDYATLQGVYTSLLSKREEAKVAANLERRQIGEQFKVLDPARVSERPFRPNRLKLNAAATAAGLLPGLAIVAFLEYRKASFATAPDVVRVLQVPVLALVPIMRTQRELRIRRWRRIAAGAVAALIVAGSAVVFRMAGLRFY